jgi:hypothetical protein
MHDAREVDHPRVCSPTLGRDGTHWDPYLRVLVDYNTSAGVLFPFRIVPSSRWLGPVRSERDGAAGVGGDGVKTGGMTPF